MSEAGQARQELKLVLSLSKDLPRIPSPWFDKLTTELEIEAGQVARNLAAAHFRALRFVCDRLL